MPGNSHRRFVTWEDYGTPAKVSDPKKIRWNYEEERERQRRRARYAQRTKQSEASGRRSFFPKGSFDDPAI